MTTIEQDQTGVAYVSFISEINATTAESLLATVYDQVGKAAGGIYILFASCGGLIDPAIAVYNSLRGLPMPLTIHNIGNVDSAANVIFMAGKCRVASRHSSFLLHGLKWNFSQGQALGRSDLTEISKNMEAGDTKISGIMSEHSSLSREEVNRFLVDAKTMDPDLALKSGVIHAIREVEIPTGVAPLQLVFPR